jgi:hypothetical protein
MEEMKKGKLLFRTIQAADTAQLAICDQIESEYYPIDS